ncbi:MAG: STAS/SEC14 domain-containing protein [Pseudomonadales bacterium]
MLRVTQVTDGIVVVDAGGKLTRDDYTTFDNELDEVMEAAAPRQLLIRLKDFQGWEPQALWKDIELDLKHRKTFERIAVVGHSTVAEWLTQLFKPFTAAEVRYFDEDKADGAIGWLREAVPVD